MVINENRQLVSCKLKNDNEIYTIDFEDLEDKIKDCKLILLCNPHNPVGRVWSVEELQKIKMAWKIQCYGIFWWNTFRSCINKKT